MSDEKVCEICGREKMPPCPHQSVEAGNNRCLSCGKTLNGYPPVFEQGPIPAHPCKRDYFADGDYWNGVCLRLGYTRELAAREAAEKGAAALRGAVERLALKLCRSVEQYDAAGRHAKSDFRDGLREAESNAAAALAAVLRDTRPTSDNAALCNPEPTP